MKYKKGYLFVINRDSRWEYNDIEKNKFIFPSVSPQGQ